MTRITILFLGIATILLTAVTFSKPCLAASETQKSDGKIDIQAIVEPSVFSMSGQVKEFSTEKKLYNYANVPFVVKFQNTGQIELKPSGQINITNYFGQDVANVAINEMGIKSLPGQIKSYQSMWNRPGGLGFGLYSANLALSYGTGEYINTKINFWIIPWEIILNILIYLAFLYILSNLLRHLTLTATQKYWPLSPSHKFSK